MHANHWQLNDIPWDQFAPEKLDGELLKIIKAAALVEYGGNRYAQYLCNVFPDDPVFQQAAKDWAVEEVQHGTALGQYAMMADPDFDFETAYRRFLDGYTFNTDAAESVRGSRSGELIARCIVETGTSSYYTALAEATEEPVLQAICRNIAADEFRHYKLFYTHLKKYLDKEELSKLERLKIGLGRVGESEDDELAFAYYAANVTPDQTYSRDYYTKAYMARAYKYYKPEHLDRVVAMVFKACGLKPHTIWHGMAHKVAWAAMQHKTRNAQKAAA